MAKKKILKQEYIILMQNNDTGAIVELSEIVSKFSIETTMEPQAGKCSLFLTKEDDLLFPKGSKVIIKYFNKNIFVGYIFTTTYDNSGMVRIVIYDSLRYLKNVATYVLSGKTAEQIFTELCNDFGVQSKVVDGCKWEVSKRIHDSKTLFEIIQFGLDECLIYTGEWFMLRDNMGVVELINLKSLKTNYFIGDLSVLSGYSFESTIDNDTYNQIKIVKENKNTEKREVFVVKDSNNIAKWGLLQYYESADENMTYEQIEKKANDLLALKNRETRKMSLKVLGCIFEIRAGSTIYVDVKELKGTGFPGRGEYIISKCVHNIEENNQTMNIELLELSLER